MHARHLHQIKNCSSSLSAVITRSVGQGIGSVRKLCGCDVPSFENTGVHRPSFFWWNSVLKNCSCSRQYYSVDNQATSLAATRRTPSWILICCATHQSCICVLWSGEEIVDTVCSCICSASRSRDHSKPKQLALFHFHLRLLNVLGCPDHHNTSSMLPSFWYALIDLFIRLVHGQVSRIDLPVEGSASSIS